MKKVKEERNRDNIQKYIRKQRVNVFGQNSPLLPIDKMIGDLMKLTDGQWGRYAFIKDYLAGKIPPNKQTDMIANAIRCGREYANKMQQEYPDLSIRESAEKMGLNISYQYRPSSGDGSGSILFAQFISPNRIEIYTDLIKKVDYVIESESLAASLIDGVDIKDILLAHEIYHYYEERDKDTIYTENIKVDTLRLGFLHNYSRVSCLGEIAAMSFTKELFELSYSPFVYDVFFLWIYNKQIACNLYVKIMKICT